jgi:hypothetical protein
VFATVSTTPLAGVTPVGSIEVAHLDDAGSTTIAFWADEASAPAGERVYRHRDALDGPPARRTPLFAQIVWVNDNGDPAVADAAERGGRERIDPAIRDVEGLVGSLAFRSADHRILVVGTATSLETHTEVGNRIVFTPLLPGEDRALLPGYDRMQLGRVVRADLPQAVRS